jgi:Bacterial toxin 44
VSQSIVPLAPKTANILDNIAEAENHPGDYLWFYKMVHDRAPWDYKRADPNYGHSSGYRSIYEEFGNFNYGATAAAAGIPLTVALRGGGFAARGIFGGWWGPRPFGDARDDQAMIRRGYYAYGTYLKASR